MKDVSSAQKTDKIHPEQPTIKEKETVIKAFEALALALSHNDRKWNLDDWDTDDNKCVLLDALFGLSITLMYIGYVKSKEERLLFLRAVRILEK